MRSHELSLSSHEIWTEIGQDLEDMRIGKCSHENFTEISRDLGRNLTKTCMRLHKIWTEIGQDLGDIS